jgi:hypothetical protein
LQPDLLEAHVNRALALDRLERYNDALVELASVLAQAPNHFGAWLNTATILSKMRRHEQSLDATERALAIRPDSAAALENRALTLLHLGRVDDARATFDRANALGVTDATMQYHEAQLLLQEGRYLDGWKRYSRRFEFKPLKGAPIITRFSSPAWDGMPGLNGKTLLVHFEQGYGDTIQFCRFVTPLARMGIRVVLEVQRPLVRLLSSLDGVQSVIGYGEQLPAFDAHCPLLSLPGILGVELASVPAVVPYVHVSDMDRAAWTGILGSRRRPRVGIVWAGSADPANPAQRSIPLSQLLPLLELDAEFISLQKDVPQGDVDTLAATIRLQHYDAKLSDFTDTAALMGQLDLVISVCTAAAHLAGSLGVPTWTLIAIPTDWRWLIGRSDSPWYPTMRLFRQSTLGDWQPVIANVRSALVQWLAEHRTIPLQDASSHHNP